MKDADYHVAVVGGGIAGLSAARGLSASDPSLKIALIESQPELGGKILTERSGGFIIEGGPDSFVSYKPWALELCRNLGLEDRLSGTNRDHTTSYILHKGRLLDLPEGLMLLAPTRLVPFALSPLFSIPGKLRMGLDLFIPGRRDAGDESLAHFVRRRMGQEAVERLAGPLLAGIYAGDPERMSLMATFPQFAELEHQHGSLIRGMLARRRQTSRRGPSPYTMFMTLRGGLAELVEALEQSLTPVKILKGCPVRRVSLRAEGGYEITVGEDRPFSAEAIILATPAYVAADMVEGFSGDLAADLRTIRYVSTATVSMAFSKEGFPHPLNGFGFVVSGGDPGGIMACTWTSTKFPHRAPGDHVLIRCFLGGEGREAVLERGDADLIRTVRENLRTTLGVDRDPVLARVFRWIRANPQYDVGHLDRVRRIEEKASLLPGLFLAGAAYHGVGIPDCVRSGTEASDRTSGFLARRRRPPA